MVTVPVRRTSLVVSAVLIPVVGGFVQMFWLFMAVLSTDSCAGRRGPAMCSGDMLFWVMWTPAFGVLAAMGVLVYGLVRGRRGAPWVGVAWGMWGVSLVVAFV